MVAPGFTLDRRSVVARLLRDRGDALVVTGLGSPSYDVHAAGDHDGNFYLWGAMGAAALVGLGLATAQPNRMVLAITGDGEALMGLGGLASIAVAGTTNLVIIVLDNGHFGETGMQQSHTGLGLDLAAVANAVGFAETGVVADAAGVEALAGKLASPATGPRLYVVRVKAENVARSLPPRDAVYGKNRLRAHLGLGVS